MNVSSYFNSVEKKWAVSLSQPCFVGSGYLYVEFWNRENNHHPEAVVINYHKLGG